MKAFLRYFLLSAIVLSTTVADAQLFRRRHAKNAEKAPKVVLVELFLGEKRLSAVGSSSEREVMQRDLANVRSKTIQDFADNFSYCPVYFFYDTSFASIQKGEFEGRLYDANMQLVKEAPLANGDTSYFILYYGYLIVNNVVSPEDEPAHPAARQTLVASNHLGYPLPYPQPRTAMMGAKDGDKSMKHQKAVYFYNSALYDIDYVPLAFQYSATLKTFYGKYPYNKKR